MTIAERLEYMRLIPSDIDGFPFSALRIIDDMWINSSNSRFGFSIQVKIWHSITNQPTSKASKLREFAKRVNWRVGDEWLKHEQLDFSLTAPLGHLPSLKWPDRENESGSWTAWRDQFIDFLAYTETCL